MFLRRVVGKSMLPTLEPGQIVILRSPKVPKAGDIVVFSHDGLEKIKRLRSVKKGGMYVVGDNSVASTDSRHYGLVKSSSIMGTVMIILPKAVNPPKLVKPYGVQLGYIVAAVLIVMALVHLFRIDTLIPIIDKVLPSGNGWASWAVSLIVIVEVFAVPFALRMRLSLLGHLFSGFFIVLAPLAWLLVSIWGFGNTHSTGELGQFATTVSDWGLIFVNVAWLALSYVTIWALGYNRLKVKGLLKK